MPELCKEHSGVIANLDSIKSMVSDIHSKVCGTHGLNTRVRVLEILMIVLFSLYGFGEKIAQAMAEILR